MSYYGCSVDEDKQGLQSHPRIAFLLLQKLFSAAAAAQKKEEQRKKQQKRILELVFSCRLLQKIVENDNELMDGFKTTINSLMQVTRAFPGNDGQYILHRTFNTFPCSFLLPAQVHVFDFYVRWWSLTYNHPSSAYVYMKAARWPLCLEKNDITQLEGEVWFDGNLEESVSQVIDREYTTPHVVFICTTLPAQNLMLTVSMQ